GSQGGGEIPANLPPENDAPGGRWPPFPARLKGGSMVRGRVTALAGLAALLIVPALAAAQAEKPVDVTGEWERTVETPGGNFTSTMKLEKKGDALSGVSVRRDGTESRLNDVKLSGKSLTFTQDLSINGMDLHLAYTGTVDG